jgi:O-antigen/teichoic acid export membrane protein
MDFKKSFFKSLVVAGGYNYATQGLSFFASIITARLLAPESFGFVGLITVFTGFISIFSDSGISLSLIKSNYRNTFHKAVDSLALYIGIALCLLTCLLAYPICVFYRNQALLFPITVMSLIFIPRSMSIVRGAILSKELKFQIIGKVSLISIGAQTILTIVMAYFNCKYWSIIIPQAFSSLIVLLMYERVVKVGFRVYSKAHVKVAIKYTRRTIGSLMAFNIINYWARNSDNLLVGRLYGLNDLGIYNRAYSLLTIPLGLITGMIGSVLYPSFNKLRADGGNVNKEYFFILRMIAFMSYPISFILILFPVDLVYLLWGNKWISVSKLLPYFGLLVFSQSLLSTSGNMLVLMNKEKALVISGWIGAIVMILGISTGALFSVEAIAQIYSLIYISVILPFNLYYVFIKQLGFNYKHISFFWLPIIIISFNIWLSLFFNNWFYSLLSLIGLLVFIILFSFKDILSSIKRNSYLKLKPTIN